MNATAETSNGSTRGLAAALLVLAALCLPACTYVAGFHPVQEPEKLGSPTPASVSFHMKPALVEAKHSFRAAGSGIAHKWVVPYRQRVDDFAVSYLSAAFTDFSESGSPATGSGGSVNVEITNVEYVVKHQAANVTIDVEATGERDNAILSQQYSARGWSGSGAVLGGGAFAQKGVTRSSTDQALKEIFEKLVADLRAAVK